jgi:hypothetical protein
VFGAGNPDGLYWAADWTSVKHCASGAAMTQWVSFSAYDEDVAVSDLPFWDTQHGTTPAQPPAVDWAQITIKVPVLQLTDPYTTDQPQWRFVGRLQSACNALGVPTPVDGVFGPQTQNSVKMIQRQFKITQDGIAGPQTWTCLDAGHRA